MKIIVLSKNTPSAIFRILRITILFLLCSYKWEIPFTFTTKSNPKFNVTDADIHWMHKTDQGLYGFENFFDSCAFTIIGETLILTTVIYTFYSDSKKKRNPFTFFII